MSTLFWQCDGGILGFPPRRARVEAFTAEEQATGPRRRGGGGDGGHHRCVPCPLDRGPVGNASPRSEVVSALSLEHHTFGERVAPWTAQSDHGSTPRDRSLVHHVLAGVHKGHRRAMSQLPNRLSFLSAWHTSTVWGSSSLPVWSPGTSGGGAGKEHPSTTLTD